MLKQIWRCLIYELVGEFTLGLHVKIVRNRFVKVTFQKVHEKGYSVTVEGSGISRSTMNPAPGWHSRLPHDAAHFIVENELGINGGIFGQLAAGGTAATFFSENSKSPRRTKKKGAEIAKANKTDAQFSEHAIYAAQARWENQAIIPDTAIAPESIARIIAGFESFAERWSKLPVGGSITFEWMHKPRVKRSR